MELTRDIFEKFKKDDQAKPEVLELGDWRGKIAADAKTNGDLATDRNPDTAVSGYADTSVQDGDEDEGMPHLLG
jgi:hypothetical protein